MPLDQKRRIYSAFREQLTEKQKEALNRLLNLPEEDKRFLYNTIRKHLTMKDINDVCRPPEAGKIAVTGARKGKRA